MDLQTISTQFHALDSAIQAKILTVNGREMLAKFDKEVLSQVKQEKDRAKLLGIFKMIAAIKEDADNILEGNSESPLSPYSRYIMKREMEKFEKFDTLESYIESLNMRERTTKEKIM